MTLTPKRQAFVDAYFECNFNATEAARKAGYKGTYGSLAVTGSRLLKDAKVKARISARLREIAMSADEVLRRLAEIARGEWGKYVDADGKVDLKRIAKDEKNYLVQSVSYTKSGDPVIKFYSAQRALETLAKHHGLLAERLQNLNIDVNDLTEEQLKRIANGEDPIHTLATSSSSGT